MTLPPLRCHLLIGPPGSGKSTFAGRLAPLLTGDGGKPGVILSTDQIREELFGSAAFQGPWVEIRTVLLQRLWQAIAEGSPVVIDATHARRPWRLLYTQQLRLPRPVEWIGWRLTTPLATCQQWNQHRPVPVPEAVIHDFSSAIGHEQFGPSRAEGFAAVVSLNPAAGETTPEAINQQLAGLDRVIKSVQPRDREKQLHRYSRLLDLERLLFLLRLLVEFNGLDRSDPGTAIALDRICTPAPVGDLADQAAVYLSRWSAVHGGYSDGYGDAEAIRHDLAWLVAHGFTRLDHQAEQPLDPGDVPMALHGPVNGGFHAMGDRRVFIRVMTLLRHILHEPFDAPTEPRPQRSGAGPLYSHLIDRLAGFEHSYAPGQEHLLRHDIDKVLRVYGFLPAHKGAGRPEALRHGYAIGTALLSSDQLLDLHAVLRSSMQRLSDASQKPLLSQLEQRLAWAGILPLNQSSQRRHAKRALAIRVFTDECGGTIADPVISASVERAIKDRRRLWLRHRPDIPDDPEQRLRDDGRFRAWPLQLLFHQSSWYLAFEAISIGRADQRGLIRVLRTDRLELLSTDGNARRTTDHDHADAMDRLERLQHVCGGLFFGDDIDAQLALMDPASTQHLQTIRFHCTPVVFQRIREEPRRFPQEQTRYSRPLPGAGWKEGPLDTLTPNNTATSHPYPVEISLPTWTVQHDWDLCTWLFRWGAGLWIESPIELRHRHQSTAQAVVALYTGQQSPAA